MANDSITNSTVKPASVSSQDTPTNAPFKDYFALFGLPVSFEIDTTQLDSQYRSLQQQYHPDKITSQANQTGTKAQYEGLSAVINNAYQTLKHPDSRATYLLELEDKADALNNSIADIEFLDDAMTLRIDLDDAINNQDLPTLQQLNPLISSRLITQSQRFQSAYESQDWSIASDAAQKLKFLVKLNADVLAGIDAVANHSDSDDDLYM